MCSLQNCTNTSQMSLQNNTRGVWNGGSSAENERGERQAVAEALVESRLPTPEGEEWKAIQKFYNLPEPTKLDNVQSKVTLPEGWTVTRDSSDPYGRCCLIYNGNGEKVGSTFLKNTGYDYYGNTYFDNKQLQKMGIL